MAGPGVEGHPHYSPRLRADVVPRTRLTDRLFERSYRLTLIAAPAGFGKTTLVLDALRTCTVPHLWFALSELDNDPTRFFSQIASGLIRLGVSTGSRLSTALDMHAPPGVMAARLLDELAGIDRSLVLVLDDYQHIESAELHGFVSRLPDILPQSVRLIIASRVDPPFPLARLRLSGELLEVRERDLRFTGDETRAFFQGAAGLALADPDARALESRTEGWAAGLQMAAISLKNEPDVQSFVRTFTGSNLYVVDYLLQEVIQRQPPEVQQFLLRTSVLMRFDARLCRAVTGMDDAERLLAETEAANLFLVSLDGSRSWYRYHNLFAELLASRFRRLLPDEWDAVHQRASIWFESEGDLASALHHAREMTTCNRLLLLLERNGYDMLSRSELGTFAAWAAAIPSGEASRYPRFLIVRGWVNLLTERIADIDPLLTAAHAAVDDSIVPYGESEKRTLRGMIAVLHAFALRLQGRFEESIEATIAALAGTEALDVRNYGLLHYNLGRGQALLGDIDAAHESFEQAYAYNLQARTWFLVFASTGSLVALTTQREGLIAGLERARSALSFTAERQLDDMPASGYLHHQLGCILLMQDDLEGAADSFATARRLATMGKVNDVLRNALVGEIRVHGARSEWDAARDLLEEFSVVVQATNPHQIDTTYEIERARIALLCGEDDLLDHWCHSQATLTSSTFSTVSETAGLLLIQVYLTRDELDLAASVIDWLKREARRRGRMLTRLQVRMGEAILLAQRGADIPITDLSKVLRKAAAWHLALPLRQYGKPARRLLERALEIRDSQNALPPGTEAFVRHILSRETARPLDPRPMFVQPLAEPLTEREQEVLFHLSRQMSYQAIADELFVSHDTVKSHVKHIYGKLGATNRGEALNLARRAQLPLADSTASA